MLISTSVAAFTRPNDTTAYASGDLVANSTTAGSVVPLAFPIWRTGQGQTIIQRMRIAKSSTTTSAAAFRLHLYEQTPIPTNGDNGVWASDKAASYLGNIDIAAFFAFTDGAAAFGSAPAGSELRLRLSSGTTLYGLMEARAGYTPAANEIFTVTLECLDGY